MEEKCAPSKKMSEGSCLTLEALVKIANAYNKKFTNKQIPIIYEKKYLVKEIYNRLKNVCNNQLCWLKQEFMKNVQDSDIFNNTFRPNGPSNSLKWLNTTNINDVIKQYYKLYPNFIFYGAVPIDFDDIPMFGIKNMNFNKLLKQKKHQIGFVFNLDEHWKSGSHWVALYADIKKNQIYFFDSYGIKPEKRIQKLMNRINNFCSKRCKNPVMRYNNIRHQFGNSECGVYSVNFILRLLKGEKFDDIIENQTTDSEVSKCRKQYFN